VQRIIECRQAARLTSGDASQVLGFPEDIFEEAALVAESLHDSGAAASIHLAPDSHISSGLVAQALTQLAAGQGTIKLTSVKVLLHQTQSALRIDAFGNLKNGVVGCAHLAPGSHVSIMHFAHALTQRAAGKDTLKLSVTNVLLTA